MPDIDPDKCRITHYPAGVLRSEAAPVDRMDDNLHGLVERMKDIMIENKGIGLAAPQAGVGLRVFIISLDGSREGVRVYINPEVTTSGELDQNEEGCLSVPGIYTKIKRYKKATVTAVDLAGRRFTEEAEGLYARALQHEYDHIRGVTIINRMGRAGRIAHRKQLKRLEEKRSADE